MIRVRVRKKNDRDALQLWYRCPLTGRRLTKSAGTDNWKEAERRAGEWETELASHRPKENPSWSEFRLRFEDECLAGKGKNTRMAYDAALNNFELHVGQVRNLASITPSIISQFAAKFSATVDSTATVAKNLRHLRAALRWAESMEMIKRAPRIVVPKSGKRRLARGRPITHAEYLLLRESVGSVYPFPELVLAWQRLIDLLWYSGLRISEALELSWDEPPLRVDLDTAKFPRLVIFGEGQKSGNDELCVIAPDFADWLCKTPVKERTGKVVKGLDHLSRSAASHLVSDCGEHAKIVTAPGKFASAHDVRRAFGQRWAKLVKPLTLQKMMRHATLATTLSFYVDMTTDDIGGDLWGIGYQDVHPAAHSSNGSKKGTRKNAAKNKETTR